MAFESLSERLGKAFKNITGKGKLSEKNMNDMLFYCSYKSYKQKFICSPL